MPKGLDYIINVRDGDLSGADRARDEVMGLDTSVSHVTESIEGMGSVATKVGGVLATALAFDSLKSAADDLIEVRGEFQGFENLLTNQLGPAGEHVFADIKRFAADTPFEVDQLTESFIKLQGSGFNPTMEKMGQIGDIAAAKMKSVDQFTEAIIDAQTGEFERLKEFGIRASKNGDMVTFTYNGIAKTMKFSQRNTEDYLLSLSKMPGITGSMAAMADTYIGKQSNVNDQMTQFKDRLANDLDPVLSGYLDLQSKGITLMQDSVDWFKENKEIIADVAIVVGSAAGAYAIYEGVMFATRVPMILMTAAQWALNAAMTANPVGIIAVGIGALIGGLVLAYKHSESFRAVLSGIGEVAGALVPIFKGVGETILGALTFNPALIKKGFEDAYHGIEDIVKGGGITGVFNKGFEASLAASKKAELEEQKKTASDLVKKPAGKTTAATVPGGKPAGSGSGSGTSVSGGRSVRNVTVTIGKLVEKLEFHTTNLSNASTADIKRELTKLLVAAVHDSELALGSQ